MKKFLALVLALVMTMSLVTISAGAKDFTDDSTIAYSEAVDVMTAIGVVGGYADGSFNPTAGLTRGAAAKIICNMLLGPTTAEALVANEAPYSDVAVDNVFAGYIAYCANEGIISGYADGTFKPAAPLTGYAFMKMLLGALGYDAVNEGYVGSNWSIQVAKRALNIGLDKGLKGDFAGAKALTREEACLYALNALKATMVEYENDTKITVGDIVVSNSSKAEKVERDESVAGTNYAGNASTDAGYGYLQFCEQYFAKLKANNGAVDGYKRPAVSWSFKNDPVGTYAKSATFTYVNEFSQDIIDDLVYDDYSFANVDQAGEQLFYNGEAWERDLNWVLTSNGKATNGFTVELFDTNDDKVFDKAIVIEACFAQIDEFTAATTNRDAKVTVKVMERGTQVTMTVIDDPKKDTDMYDKLTAFEEGDFVAVIMKGDFAANTAAGATYIKAVSALEAVEGTISRVNASNKGTAVSSIIVDGTTYYLNNEFVELDDTTVTAGVGAVKAADKGTLYLDAQGCVVGWVVEESANDDDHIAVTDVFNTLVDGKIVTKVTGVLANGETATFTLEGTAPVAYDGNIYVFEDDDKNGKFEFTTETLHNGYAIYDNETKVDYMYFAKDVNYIFVDCTVNAEEVTVLAGTQDVASASNRYFVTDVVDGITYITAVYVIAAPSNGNVTTEDIIFVNGAKTGDLELDTDADENSETYYTYSAYVDGVKVEDFYSGEGTNSYTFYKSVKNEKTGAYSLANANKFVTDTKVGVTAGATTYVSAANTITINGVVLGTAGATIVDLSANENGISYVTSAAAVYDVETMEATVIYLTATT